MSGRLLEKLAKEEHCFISDLNRACDYEEIIRYLKGLDLSQYLSLIHISEPTRH